MFALFVCMFLTFILPMFIFFAFIYWDYCVNLSLSFTGSIRLEHCFKSRKKYPLRSILNKKRTHFSYHSNCQTIRIQSSFCSVFIYKINSRQVFNPFIFLIMSVNNRKFDDFIQVQYEIYDHNRQFQYKCADASQWYCNAPQGDTVTQHSEFRVSACCKDSAYCHAVY